MLDRVIGFDWDDGNRAKCRKHGVSITEIESLFAYSFILLPDVSHSLNERRYLAVGRGADGRYIFVVFTLRRFGGKTYIRPISARFMHRKEIQSYEKEENPDLPNR